jgi:hypothetical protein
MISSRAIGAVVFSLVAAASRAADAGGDAVVAIGASSRARFATPAEGAGVLTRRDAFLSAMTPFDRSARLQVGREVPESEYLAFVSKEVREWSPAERELLRPILDAFREKTAAWKLDLPAEILFVKTTGREEGGAAYCRGAAVVLPETDLANPKLRDVVFHELFHVYSSHHPEMRRELYGVLGFEVCPEIALPPAMARRKLTNPDAPRTDAFIRLPDGGETVAAAPIILGRSDLYDEKVGGPFFKQMDFRLMVLDGAGTGASPRPALQPDGSPRFVPPGDAYMARIGRNTEYIIHPEEILADNFVLLVNGAKVQSPEILEKLDAALRAARR